IGALVTLPQDADGGRHWGEPQRVDMTHGGKPDWADRPTDKPDEWLTRPRNKAGTVYKYNDTRVNVLALAALNLWRRPLPQVLKEKFLDRWGASNTWGWFGHDNAWVVIDGEPVQSVTGGGHWGGGIALALLRHRRDQPLEKAVDGVVVDPTHDRNKVVLGIDV